MTKKRIFGIIAFTVIMVFGIIACSSGSGKVLNSAADLKEYLDKQPANSPDKPIKVRMNVNDLMIKDIVEAIKAAGKYVDLDLSKSEGLTKIGNNDDSFAALFGQTKNDAFENCINLTNITLPNSVTEIGRGAFSGCTGLSNINLSNNVSVIGSGAFKGCTKLTNIVLPNSVTIIRDEAFSGCTGLINITIPNSVTEIWEEAFSHCENLLNFEVIGADDNSILNGIWILEFRDYYTYRATYTFNDGLYNYLYERFYYGRVSELNSESGIYCIKDDKLFFLAQRKGIWTRSFSLSGNKLILEGYSDETGFIKQ